MFQNLYQIQFIIYPRHTEVQNKDVIKLKL
uniref:Uncharacterized protein n=1 Tax=Arundo donax TaxID=35708 RepID=A0A0A9BSJ1_ARUDO